jgi:hypothetical protein
MAPVCKSRKQSVSFDLLRIQAQDGEPAPSFEQDLQVPVERPPIVRITIERRQIIRAGVAWHR